MAWASGATSPSRNKIGGRFLLLDRGEEFLRGLFTESRQRGHEALAARLLELRDAGDLQLLIERLDLFFPESRNLKKLQNVARELVAQLLVEFESSRCNQLLDLFCQGLANAIDFVEFVAFGGLSEIAGVHFHRARAVYIGADFERVFSLEREVPRDVFEDAGNRVGGDGGFGAHPVIIACRPGKRQKRSARARRDRFPSNLIRAYCGAAVFSESSITVFYLICGVLLLWNVIRGWRAGPARMAVAFGAIAAGYLAALLAGDVFVGPLRAVLGYPDFVLLAIGRALAGMAGYFLILGTGASSSSEPASRGWVCFACFMV